MFHPGLVSVSFRKLSCEELIKLTAESRLSCIEWGSDVHVLPGDAVCARRVEKMMADNGLFTSSYGSYFRAGVSDTDSFLKCVESCILLKSPTIRVWAGTLGPRQEKNRSAVAASLAGCCEKAAQNALTVTLECHQGTLTETEDSALLLLREVGHPALRLSWQPKVGGVENENGRYLASAVPYLETIHCYHRSNDNLCQALEAGKDEWKHYLDIAAKSGRDIPVLLEFFKDDSVEQFKQDAAVLLEILNG